MFLIQVENRKEPMIHIYPVDSQRSLRTAEDSWAGLAVGSLDLGIGSVGRGVAPQLGGVCFSLLSTISK